MKQYPTLRADACRKAVKKGPRIFNYNGKDYVAFGMTKDELDTEIFAPAGFNTDKGSAWLNQIFLWRKLGTFVQPEFVVKDKTRNDWWVAFLTLTPSEQSCLDAFAEAHNCNHILKGDWEC